jgi:tetratricopeptide (TPR) repeat protein
MRRGTALIHLGHLHEALRILVGALRRVEAAGDLGTLWLTLNNLGSLTSRLGEFEQTRQYAERALEVAERIGNPSHISFILGNLGDILTSRGDWDAARDSLARGVEVARAAGPGTRSRVSDVATPLAFLGQLDLRRGDWEEASRLLAEALAAAEESEDRQGREIAQAGLAELDVLAGRAEQAVARLEPLLADDAALGLLLPILAWAYLETGNEESMRRAAELAAEAVSRGREQPGEYLVEPLWMQGMVLVRQGRSKEAQAVLQEGLGLARSLPHPYAEARILYQLGTMPRVWADREAGAGARERLHEALVIFQRLGAKKDIERTEQALAELAAV